MANGDRRADAVCSNRPRRVDVVFGRLAPRRTGTAARVLRRSAGRTRVDGRHRGPVPVAGSTSHGRSTITRAAGHMVDYRITAAERTQFKRCRRQWDFASPHRRNLRSTGFVEPALPAALKDALAVYYYPGTWDWQHEVTQPLVHRALERSLEDAGATDELDRAAALLDCYDAWAHTVDDFAPVKINLDVDALVPDPEESERGLVVHDGSPVIYPSRIDLVAVDAADEYWVVCHRIVDEWLHIDTLVRDEQAVA